MEAKYLSSFTFPSEKEECAFLCPKDLTPDEIINSVYRDYSIRSQTGSRYPFMVFDQNKLQFLKFDSNITVFCGGNGSGKTTALNVIAEKIGLKRESAFNSGRYFQEYLNMCKYRFSGIGSDKFVEKARNKALFLTPDSRIIVSDDVFAYAMKQRKNNDQYNRGISEAEYEYSRRKKSRERNFGNRFEFLKNKLGEEAKQHSNGETSMLYFTERMGNPGLYLLDEPENSLSMENQIALAEYIESSARFFDCQFIIATHSPVFLAMKGAEVYDFDESPVRIKKWTEVSSVRKQYEFFENHEKEFT